MAGKRTKQHHRLLITADVFTSDICTEINDLHQSGKKIPEIMKLTGLSRASVHSYLPYTRDVYVENRRHTISGVHQQRLKDEPDQDLSYAYISTNSTFDAMPDELYILLVVERENEVYSHECPFNTIFITGMSNTDILGRYCAEDVIGDDCLLHYRKYVKDKTATSGLCILYMQHEENTVFYHANPYFDVETILKSDDDDFKNRVSLPF